MTADSTKAQSPALVAVAGPGYGYHHRDLRRALVSAARTLLEREGSGALTLRGAARAAGVSTASPYHHFKSVEELRRAVAEEGWRQLVDALTCGDKDECASERLVRFGVTCVQFAQDHPALYGLMGKCLRCAPPPAGLGNTGIYDLFRQAVADDAQPGAADTPGRLELATTAAWGAVHGLAEICRWKALGPLKATLGGERAFVVAVLRELKLCWDRPVEG